MLNVFLTFAGICLCINGLTLYYSESTQQEDRICSKDAAIVNLFTGVLGFIVIHTMLNQPQMSVMDYSSAAYIGLFALTYTWVGINAFTGSNGRALGWFSLLVSMIALPVSLISFRTAHSTFEYWLSASWLAWAVLWFMFFILLAKNKRIAKPTGAVSFIQGISTASLPALLGFWNVIQ